MAKLLNASEVAALLGVSKSFIYQLVRAGELRAVRIGSAVRIRQEDVDAFISENLVDKHDPWLSKRSGL